MSLHHYRSNQANGKPTWSLTHDDWVIQLRRGIRVFWSVVMALVGRHGFEHNTILCMRNRDCFTPAHDRHSSRLTTWIVKFHQMRIRHKTAREHTVADRNIGFRRKAATDGRHGPDGVVIAWPRHAGDFDRRRSDRARPDTVRSYIRLHSIDGCPQAVPECR
jgi:hypothetical protein